jgi:hypothetical protein
MGISIAVLAAAGIAAVAVAAASRAKSAGKPGPQNVVSWLPSTRTVLVATSGPDDQPLTISSEYHLGLDGEMLGLAVSLRRREASPTFLWSTSPATGGQLPPPLRGQGYAALEWGATRVCGDGGATIVYGLLRVQTARVIIEGPMGRRVLHKARVPPSIRPSTLLVYGWLPSTVLRLRVVAKSGRLLVKEDTTPIVVSAPCVRT